MEPVGKQSIQPWQAKAPDAYSGTYHFGFSEGESLFTLKVGNGAATASRQYTEFDKNGQTHEITRLFTHVRIVSNDFFSDQTNGRFVAVGTGRNRTYGLLVFKPWCVTTPKGKTEIGVRQ